MRLRKLALASLAVFVMSLAVTQFDRGVSDWLHDSLLAHDSWLQLMTAFGDGRFLIPTCVVVGLCFAFSRKTHWQVPAQAVLAILLSGAVTHVLKVIIGRPRPYALRDGRYLANQLETFQWFTLNKDFASFPSGHSTAVFAVAWVVARKTSNRFARAGVFSLASLVALTRVALAKHYVADTIAGAAIGIFFAEVCLRLLTALIQSRLRRHLEVDM